MTGIIIMSFPYLQILSERVNFVASDIFKGEK